ncbi:DEAD/DEAH box helicase [Arthrobacter sp. StoSoilA2]|uniref:DEAD/DEAH box helicase n=1 Tax=Arthrobacter sp. StoSoilA2 TaxID=2830990 RepID=UPI001CC6E895|nr:DEAD/DEAH box helicase [Arthrobacter sp. StoSoilA2]
MLDLRFSLMAGRVDLSCDEGNSPHLRMLATRFSTSLSLHKTSISIELDDFLVNLRELARWPADDVDVRWDGALLRLVEGNVQDSTLVDARLNAEEVNQLPVPVLPPNWVAPLTEHQTRDLSKLMALNHGANFSVPGAGKTRASMAIYAARRAAGSIERMLVVCPKSAFESWEYEAGVCFQGEPMTTHVWTGGLPPDADILLVNYERLPNSLPPLITWMKAASTLLVLDEAHRMKLGSAGAWGSACLTLGPYATNRLILTGTPAPNGSRDLESLFSFVWPGQGRAAVQRAVAHEDLAVASRALKPLFTRTTKSELDLPPVDISIRRVDLPPLHREIYDALLGQGKLALASEAGDMAALGKILLYLLMAATSPALLAVGSDKHEALPYRVPPYLVPEGATAMELLRDLPLYELNPKYQEVRSIVEKNAAKGRKTLIWSTFVRNLKSLERMLAEFNPALIHGGTIDRDEELKRFRQDPTCAVLLSNPATLGEGVSLHHACHDAVYVDRDFSAGRFLQSLDRIHRLGLAPSTITKITVLAATGTIDEVVEDRLARKLEFMGGILDDPNVRVLGDLEEEVDESVGMDMSDLAALTSYLNR